MTNESRLDGAGERHGILVVANETCPCPALLEEVAARADRPGGQVLVLAPALNSRLAHWVSDTDGAVAAARERVEEAVSFLRADGVDADGDVGDADPRQAIEDTVCRWEADEIVIGTHPPGESHWLEAGLVEAVRERHGLPVTHVVTPYGLVREGA